MMKHFMKIFSCKTLWMRNKVLPPFPQRTTLLLRALQLKNKDMVLGCLFKGNLMHAAGKTEQALQNLFPVSKSAFDTSPPKIRSPKSKKLDKIATPIVPNSSLLAKENAKPSSSTCQMDFSLLPSP
ncbi:hypothetical protein J1N35_014398 [Gossypium stocksii]|uniref:Uncharacterized protein n=1 Tax=Gossypium stocksii TaxID=47602 RepID=A0A9D4A9W3_9ROSI|nr:hypothetical protein J1N35_014398 [Gossypium stocksii]